MSSRLGWVGAALAGCLLAGGAHAAPTTTFTLTGAVGTPGIHDGAALQALPPTTETVTHRAGSGSVTDTFTGLTTWSLLLAAGGTAAGGGVPVAWIVRDCATSAPCRASAWTSSELPGHNSANDPPPGAMSREAQNE